MNLPRSWPQMKFAAKMAYLVNTFQAKDFKDARDKILNRGRKPVDKATSAPIVQRLPYADN